MANHLAKCSHLINVSNRESPCARVKRKKQTQLESSQNAGKRVIKFGLYTYGTHSQTLPNVRKI